MRNGGRPNKEEALQAVAVINRIRRAIAEVRAGLGEGRVHRAIAEVRGGRARRKKDGDTGMDYMHPPPPAYYSGI